MLINEKEELFYEKYRPQRIQDLILPEAMKTKLQSKLDSQNLPNLGLFSNSPGTGKTSTAKAIITEFLNKYGGESLFINASLDNGIDTLRSEIQKFACQSSFDSKIKIVVLDEGDKFSEKGQAAFRGFIEEFSSNCRFIFTGNYKENIIPALLDRLECYDYNELPKNEMIVPIFERLKFILDNEKIEYNPNDLIPVINTFYPSIRSMVKTLQQCSSTGKFILNEKELDQVNSYNSLINNILENNFKGIISEANLINNPSSFYKMMYSKVLEINHPKINNPLIIISLAKYQHMDLSVRDKNLNLCACCVEISNLLK